MKTKINGVEVEGTPDEILELIRMSGKEKIAKGEPVFDSDEGRTLKKMIQNSSFEKRAKSSSYNTKYLRLKERIIAGEALTKVYVDIYKHSPSKIQSDSMKHKLYTDGVVYKRPHQINEDYRERLSKFAIAVSEEIKKGKTRIDAVNELKYMIKKKPNLPIQPADYNKVAAHKASEAQRNELVLDFPKFRIIDEKYQKILENMVRNCIGNKGKLTFYVEGAMLELTDGALWHEFVVEFMQKSREILAVFNAKGRFTVEKLGFKNEIVYKGDYS